MYKRQLKRFFHENRRTALGILMAAAGIVVLTAMSQRVGFLNTKITWCIGVPADALLGAGTVLLMRDFLQRHYRDWVPQDSDFYDEWKVKFRKQQNLILVVALLALFFVLMYFFVQTRIYYGYYYNLAFSYLMAATVMLLFGLIEYTVPVSYTHLDVYKRQDCHISMMLTATQILNDMRSELCGTVKLAFQPAEEIAVGAKAMIADGALEGVEGCFAIHVWTDVPSGHCLLYTSRCV